MRFWFDMDGTIADLYAVENWLPKLRAHDATPYMEARPLIRLCTLAYMLNRIVNRGHEIGIISWLSKDKDAAYAEAVTGAKKAWLKKHMPSVKWTHVYIVPYGTPKSEAVNIQPCDILFDDEKNNQMEWEENGGWAFDPCEIFTCLKRVII